MLCGSNILVVIAGLCESNAKVLLNVFESKGLHDQRPPFPTYRQSLADYCHDYFCLTELLRQVVPAVSPHLKNRGCYAMEDVVYILS